jgi:uncharacterized protein (DUF2164 family)
LAAPQLIAIVRLAEFFPDTMRNKRTLELTTDARKLAIASIRRHFQEALDHDIGDLKASLVLDFVLAELGPSLYNMGIADAKAFFADRTEDLAALSLEEFTYWPSASRRRGDGWAG